MKSGDQLSDIDRDAGTRCLVSHISPEFIWIIVTDDVLVRMMDDRTAESSRTLYGHSGPIYSLSFSPDRNLLLSSSEDTTGNLKNCKSKIISEGMLKSVAHCSTTLVSSHLDVRRLLQRSPLPSLVGAILTSRLLLCDWIPRQNGQTLGHRRSSASPHFCWTLFRRWCKFHQTIIKFT